MSRRKILTLPGASLLITVAVAPLMTDSNLAAAPSVVRHAGGYSTGSDRCPWPRARRDYSLIEMRPIGQVRAGDACGRAIVAWSPFGVATTREGHVIYDIELFLPGLEGRRTGPEQTYIAWALSRDLQESHRIGVVTGGRVRGQVWFNQYLIVVTAESDPQTTRRTGPIVLRGRSPTGWLEPFHHHSIDGTGMPSRH